MAINSTTGEIVELKPATSEESSPHDIIASTHLDSLSVEIKPATSEPPLHEFLASTSLDSLPQSLKRKLNIPKVKKILKGADSLSFLVTGRTGTGKSTLINGILGLKMAYESDRIAGPGSLEVKSYTKRKGKILVTLWDSRGLLDGTSTEEQEGALKQMVDKCSQVDLKLFCVDFTQKKFLPSITENLDVVAMVTLTEVFGEDFWNNTVIVLTFANVLEAKQLDWIGLPPEKKAKAFADKIGEWENLIRRSLQDFAKVSQKIAKSIKVIPAGHYKIRQLPDRAYWLSDLFFECLETLPTPEAKGALLQVNQSRFKLDTDVTEEEFASNQPEDQPIVISTKNKSDQSTLANILLVLGSATGGTFAGATIGLAALAAGPLGAAIGVPTGALLGFCVGLTFGFHKLSEQGNEEKKNA